MNDNITEINKDTFWALIQEAKDTCGQDTDAWAKYMIDRLAGLGPDQSLMFLNYMDAYKDLSFRYGLWDAAKIFRVDGCSDDSFSYFRSWLIVQGKDVYMAALADPDSLADVEPYADCFFETAGYVGAYAYKKLTGEYAFEHLDYDYLLALENELVKDIWPPACRSPVLAGTKKPSETTCAGMESRCPSALNAWITPLPSPKCLCIRRAMPRC